MLRRGITSASKFRNHMPDFCRLMTDPECWTSDRALNSERRRKVGDPDSRLVLLMTALKV
jgi:hypothetical protein